MGTYGDAFTQTIPAVGSSGTGYATNINLFLTEVQTRLSSKVPLTSVQAGTFDLQNNPLNNAEWVALFQQSSTPILPTGSLQNFNGDLWWVSPSGAVQLTTGNHVNSTSIGGITGDYGLGPEQFRYSVATGEYTAYVNFGAGTYGLIWAQNFDISAASTGSTRVRLSAAGVGGSYTLTVPAALPAATASLTISTSGQMATLDAVTRNVVIPASAALSTGNTFAAGQLWNFATTNHVFFPVILPAGATVTSVSICIIKGSNNTFTMTATLQSYSFNTGASVGSISDSTNAPGNKTIIIPSLSHTTVASESLFVDVQSTNSAGADNVCMVQVFYTNPT